MNLPPFRKLFKTNTLHGITVFFAKKIFPIESHLFYEINLKSIEIQTEKNDADFSFARVTDRQSTVTLPSEIEEKLNMHAGTSLSQRLLRGEQAFLMFYKKKLACQLFMSHKKTRVDTPIPLVLEYGNDSWFLSFLYTHTEYRNRGFAQALISFACRELQKEGYSRCLAHIRTTNLASVYSFEKAGWNRIGTLYSSPEKNKLFNSKKLSKHRINLYPIS